MAAHTVSVTTSEVLTVKYVCRFGLLELGSGALYLKVFTFTLHLDYEKPSYSKWSKVKPSKLYVISGYVRRNYWPVPAAMYVQLVSQLLSIHSVLR